MSSRRRARASSTSIARQTPSFIVTASGWAPPIPPSPAVSDEPPAQRAAEVLAGQLGERLVRALEDPLGPDVDPGPGGHLAVHHQALALELAEDAPRSPTCRRGSSSRSGRAAPTRASGRPPTGLPDWIEQRLVVAERAQLADDRVEGVPAPRRPAGPAVDDEVRRGPRRPPDRGCSSASAGRPPAASRGRSARCRAGARTGRGRSSSAIVAAAAAARGRVTARVRSRTCSPSRARPTEVIETDGPGRRRSGRGR